MYPVLEVILVDTLVLNHSLPMDLLIFCSRTILNRRRPQFVNNAFRDGTLKTTGTDLDKIMPPMRRFGGGDRLQQKNSLIEKLKEFFDKYFGLV